jgi:hypothetical protein
VGPTQTPVVSTILVPTPTTPPTYKLPPVVDTVTVTPDAVMFLGPIFTPSETVEEDNER